jgi:hypothetical protein
MPRQTLLELTQNILNATDGDEVNSIGDTTESMQVAEVIRETYYDIITGVDIPRKAGIIRLDASIDPDQPHIMTCPSDAEVIEWIKYNGKIVQYLTPLAFVNHVALQENGGTQYGDFFILTDRDPEFYTSFDDETLIFNSFNSQEDSTLQQSKTLCWGQKVLPFEMEDSFVPILPANMFSRLLSEAKAVCFINYKQVANTKEEQRARRQLVRGQNERYKSGKLRPIDRLPDYGRSSPRIVSRRTS